MEKRYELEVSRSNITPKQFYNYCKKRFEEKTPTFLESWLEYEQWESPITIQDYEYTKHNNGLIEASKIKPYEFQIFLQNTYNFILEFEFDKDNKGHGYMYAVEFD